MVFKDLREYIKELEKRQWIQSVETSVDPELEITEIADRVSKVYGSALMFNKVKGSSYPLVINLMGTFERLNLGLGTDDLNHIGDEIEGFMDLGSYATLKDKIKAIPKLAPLPFIFPKKVKHAPCQQVVEEADLDKLPIIKCWPEDGGKYLTLPLVFTKDPKTQQQNVGMYRMQVYDKKTTGMHWHLHKDGHKIYQAYKEINQRMPVSVALGCDPTIIYSATAPLPKMIDEMLFAGFLKKRPVEMVKCISNDIYVPAHAEFILEGYVELDELRREGPFGDHTGYYSLADDYPVFHIEKITHRKNPIYPTTIVGKPPMEDCYLGKATERIFLPLMKLEIPEIVDLDFPLEGVFHNCAIVSMNKEFPAHAQKLLYALWGAGQMMYTKMIIVVDACVDVHDYKAVLEAIFTNVTQESHLILTQGPLDALDHASDKAFEGFRLGVDATVKLEAERGAESLGIKERQLSIQNFDKKQKGKTKDYLEEALSRVDEEANLWILLVDPWIDVENMSTVAWKLFNNIDPMRDMIKIVDTKGRLRLGIDATKKGLQDGHKRPWPNDIEMTEEIKRKVTERWQEYGIHLD